MNAWYPQDKKELNKLLEGFLEKKPKLKISSKKISGLIVPHAGYAYSGEIAGKAYSLLKDSKSENKTAIILAPSHYILLRGIESHNQQIWKTCLGEIEIQDSDFPKAGISEEHAIGNQIPFLQKLGFKKILPLMVGEISAEESSRIAEKLSKINNAVFIISSDLSHFLAYEQAMKKDRQTIKAIENLDSGNLLEIGNSTCGIYPVLIMIELCRIKKLKPKLLEYKNSGDITGDKSSVVGYASMVF